MTTRFGVNDSSLGVRVRAGLVGRSVCVCCAVQCCGCEGMWSLFASSVELPCFKRQIIKKDLFLIHK